MIRSMSYRWYFRIPTPMATGSITSSSPSASSTTCTAAEVVESESASTTAKPRLAVNLAFPVLLIGGLGSILQPTVGRVTGLIGTAYVRVRYQRHGRCGCCLRARRRATRWNIGPVTAGPVEHWTGCWVGDFWA